MVYLPEELVDIIIEHSIEINARHHMQTKVLPQFLDVHNAFMTFRCEQCSEEGMICIDCAHYHDYKTGPGHYCGQKYVIDEMLNTDKLPIYMDNLSMWSNGMDIDIYMGGYIGHDQYSAELKYSKDKYTKGTLEHLCFMGRVRGIDDQSMLIITDMYCCFKPLGYNIDHANIKSFCRATGISDFTAIFNLWLECMYET